MKWKKHSKTFAWESQNPANQIQRYTLLGVADTLRPTTREEEREREGPDLALKEETSTTGNVT